VYSIELLGENDAEPRRILAQNPILSANVHTFHMRVSDREGETCSIGKGSVKRHGLSVGFLALITHDITDKVYGDDFEHHTN
jgi:hypothetical protein